MSEFLYNSGIGEGFLTMSQNLEAIKEKVDKFDYLKTKFCMSKSNTNKFKRQQINGEKNSQIYHRKKILIFLIYK